MGRTFGTPGFDTAKLCFAENLERFINPDTHPHEYNLNKGLYQLVMGLEALEREIKTIRSEIAALHCMRLLDAVL